MGSATTAEILQRARETLQTAALGLTDMKDPRRRLSGLRNLVVFGRAVTNVLQNLRSTESTFDAWYGPVQRDLAADPLMKFFYELRSKILKRGDTGTGDYMHLKSLDIPTDLRKFGSPPANARSFFIGDPIGGTGWEVEIAPGVTEKFYVDLPSDIGVAGVYFRAAPGIRGREVSDGDALVLSAKYLNRLDEVLATAEGQFGGAGD